MISKDPALKDVKVGDEIPRLVVGPVTLQDLVEWYGAEGESYVEPEIWTANQRGEKTTPGTAVVILPSRSST